MAKIWELLDQVHYFIGLKRYAEAQSILDQILYTDPQNVEAWDAYMRSCTTRRDLEGLKNYIATVWDTRVRDQDYLFATQRFILQRVDEKISGM
jgi:tetratricopeptide (TPR) repeat protein